MHRRWWVFLVVLATIPRGGAARAEPAWTPVIPRTWDDRELARMTLPAALPDGHIVYPSADWYYRIPVEPVFRSYPAYAPGREPAGYRDWLRSREPEVVFDPKKLRTRADWIAAGEVVFQTPASGDSVFVEADWFRAVKPPLAKDGSIPQLRYVVRKKGRVELGSAGCAFCHARVMPDGAVIFGAQGNYPAEQDYAFALRQQGKLDHMQRLWGGLLFPEARRQELTGGLYERPVEEVARAHEAMIPGVVARGGFSVYEMPKIADLIGVKDRRYLDLTARLEQRSIADLMRYATLSLGDNYFFSPSGTMPADKTPPAEKMSRWSDEVLFALATYVYAIEPPPNPNRFDEEARHGQKVFERQGCELCHTPPLFTSNELLPAGSFRVPEGHRERYDILDIRPGADARSATASLRGRGYYKVPSLKGVWYRGPFEHNGSVATLEDWFDPRRLQDDYVPTGFRGLGVTHRAVRGHRFGLTLSPEDRRALVAYLKTL